MKYIKDFVKTTGKTLESLESYTVTYSNPDRFFYSGLGYYAFLLESFSFNFIRELDSLLLKVTFRSSKQESSIVWQTDDWIDTYSPAGGFGLNLLTIHLGNNVISLQPNNFQKFDKKEVHIEEALFYLARKSLFEICEAETISLHLTGRYGRTVQFDRCGFLEMARIFYHIAVDQSEYVSTMERAIEEKKQIEEIKEKWWHIQKSGCIFESILITILVTVLCVGAFKVKGIIVLVLFVMVVLVAIARRKMADQYYYEE